MNLEEMKKTGVNKVGVSDSLNAPLLQLNIKLNENTQIPNERELKIYVDDDENDITNRKTFVFNFSYPLQRVGEQAENFILEPIFKGNKIKMRALVNRKTKLEQVERNVAVGDDLSGKTLNLNFPTILGTYSNYYPGLFASSKYRIRECYDHAVNAIELFNIETGTVVDILYSQTAADNATINLTNYKLPDDFGIVSNVINPESTFADAFQYIKIDTTEIVSSSDSIEELAYQPITLFEGTNYISTNYQNATLEFIYPQNTDITKYFLWNSYVYEINNDDKFLTLDDIYFKDCFTEIEENVINALFNKLTIKCMNSTNNNFSLDCDGNLTVNSIYAKTTPMLTFNQIYPIGSIYMSVNSTNPSALFGGTWEQIKDKFLLSCGNTYANGTTGGTATEALTTNQIPSHTHTFAASSHTHTYAKPNATSGSTTLTIEQIPSHTHTLLGDLRYNGNSSWWIGGTGGTVIEVGDHATTATGGNSGHTHSIATTNTSVSSAPITGTNSNTGGGAAHNNMPPYIAVYVWKRIA